MKEAIRRRVAPPSREPRRFGRRRVRLVADLGLALVLVLAVEVGTGVVLFAVAHGLTPKGSAWANRLFVALATANLLVLQDVPFQADVHVWTGYLSTAVVVLKGWASWPTLIGWRPRGWTAARLTLEKGLAGAILVLAPASYLSGIALAMAPHLLSLHLLRDVHLGVSALLVPPLLWHLGRFLPIGLKVARIQARHTWARRCGGLGHRGDGCLGHSTEANR